MIRDFSKLDSSEFDLLVIGGGIAGAGVAWDAALRGLRVLLVEKGDFGAATSSGCYKIVHGGLRYLQHLDFKRSLESIREQRALRYIAPHLVHPLPFLVPCYQGIKRGKEILSLGMNLYELLGAGRNRDIDDYHHLPRHRFISKDQTLQIAPGLNTSKLTSGLIYFDCQMSSCERLTFSVIRAAADAGACVINYAEVNGAQSITVGDGKFSEVIVRDLITGNLHKARAQVVVNASGPWVDSVLQGFGAKRTSNSFSRNIFSKGFQVVLPQFIKGFAVAVESSYEDKTSVVSRGGRSFFLTPWRNHTMLGTADSLFVGEPDTFKLDPEEIRNFVLDAASAYSNIALDPKNIRFVYGGLRPIDEDYVDRAAEVPLMAATHVSKKDEIIDHEFNGGPENLISMIPVKYTTFRGVSEGVVNLVQKKLGQRQTDSITAQSRVYGGEIADYAIFLAQKYGEYSELFPQETIYHLASHYGTRMDSVINLVKRSSQLGAPLGPKTQVLRAEIIHAVREEMSLHLSDVAFRRTGLGTLGNPGTGALVEAANLLQGELGWSESEKVTQIERAVFTMRSGLPEDSNYNLVNEKAATR